jgi:NAD(P)-dependent dehydrogenase (short-subunit alcohol dehydrogenase family)
LEKARPGAAAGEPGSAGRSAYSFGAQREAILARGARLPVGRIGRPEEVAAAVIFLMNNGFVTCGRLAEGL